MRKINVGLTINKLQDDLINKRYSCVEMVDFYLDRIEKKNKSINALITICADLAYIQAKKVDRLISFNNKNILKDYPLLGVGVVHKDLFLTKNIRTTAGAKLLSDYFPPFNASIVERMEKLGCILVGKANCDAWAHGSSGENSDFGATKNPWNESFVPGGSSSGSGASLACNFSLLATGTDTCGSVRLPANYCGNVGLKPTYGSLSRYGVIAMASSLDCVGLYAHSVLDIEKVFNLLKGEDSHDSTIANENLRKNIDYKKRKIKIGVPKEFFLQGLDSKIKSELKNVIKVFEKLGYDIIDISLPHTEHAISVYYIIQPAEVSSNLARYDGIRYGGKRDAFSEEAKRRIMLGTYVLSSGYYDEYYLKAMKVRSIIIKEIDTAFKKVDALIAPVAPTPPFKLGEKIDDPLKMYLTDILAATANLSGIPSIAIPSSFTNDNLPLGFQIMADRFSENVLFSLGHKFHESINWTGKTL